MTSSTGATETWTEPAAFWQKVRKVCPEAVSGTVPRNSSGAEAPASETAAMGPSLPGLTLLSPLPPPLSICHFPFFFVSFFIFVPFPFFPFVPLLIFLASTSLPWVSPLCPVQNTLWSTPRCTFPPFLLEPPPPPRMLFLWSICVCVCLCIFFLNLFFCWLCQHILDCWALHVLQLVLMQLSVGDG